MQSLLGMFVHPVSICKLDLIVLGCFAIGYTKLRFSNQNENRRMNM
jgi:hypothetical protein